MAIAVSAVGEFEGRRVDEAVLESSDGVSVNIMNWGVVVRDWKVPAGGTPRSVVLGFDTFAPYPGHSPHFGALAGRVANRIGGSSFVLDGKRYDLVPNEGTTHLHGGPGGLGRQVWAMETDSQANAVRFTLDSPDGDMGYPGNVQFEAVYRLDGKTLRLELSGIPDRPTPISLVQHQYFNLGLGDTVVDHTVHMPYCVARTESDEKRVMNGVISPIHGTQYDFLAPRTMRDSAGAPVDYDLNLVLATHRDFADPIAIATGEDGVLTLKLRSDQPGLQFYDGIMTDIAVPGHGGKTYGKYSGLCFEDQMFPDAVHQKHFPDVICTPDKPYRHWCEIEIG
jgi:aldose 1-epimerase